MKRFRVSAKNFFLTYPRCTLTKDQLLQSLLSIPTPTEKKYIRVSLETHEDGTPHLHCLIQFAGKFVCTNYQRFDVKHPCSSRVFHPNLQGARSSSDVNTYISKHCDYLEWGTFQIDGRSARGGCQKANDSYAKALNSESTEQALQILKQEQPKDFVLHHDRLLHNLGKIFQKPRTPFCSKFSIESFKIHEDLQQWLADTFMLDDIGNVIYPVKNNNVQRPLSLILEGPSRTGKTEWARSLGHHNYLSGHLDFNSNCFSNSAVYNVIDDVSPSYLKMKHWKELLGAQSDWQSNCKYGKPVQIKGGKPAIVICNPGEDFSFSFFLGKPENDPLREWTLKNVIFVTICNPLF